MPVAAMLNPVYISSETFDAMNLNIGNLRRDLHTNYQSISVYGTEIYEKCYKNDIFDDCYPGNKRYPMPVISPTMIQMPPIKHSPKTIPKTSGLSLR